MWRLLQFSGVPQNSYKPKYLNKTCHRIITEKKTVFIILGKPRICLEDPFNNETNRMSVFLKVLLK